jgi:hypothetical protein
VVGNVTTDIYELRSLGERGLNVSGSVERKMAGCFEHGRVFSFFVKCRDFTD